MQVRRNFGPFAPKTNFWWKFPLKLGMERKNNDLYGLQGPKKLGKFAATDKLWRNKHDDMSKMTGFAEPDLVFKHNNTALKAHSMQVRKITQGIVLGLAVAVGPVLGHAQDTGGFTFKKIKVHQSSGGKRITVQISPEDDYYLNAGKPKAAENVSADTSKSSVPDGFTDWFWSATDHSISGASGSRLDTALLALQKEPAKAAELAPRIADVRTLADRYGKDILQATLGIEVSPALVLSVLSVESGGRSDAVSTAGAVGVMQLIPETAARFDVKDSTDPVENIRGGAAYLGWLLSEFKRDPLLALAGYNAGENAVKDHQGVPPYKETRRYVPKVVAAWQVAASLCVTPPKRVTDGCVFKQKDP